MGGVADNKLENSRKPKWYLELVLEERNFLEFFYKKACVITKVVLHLHPLRTRGGHLQSLLLIMLVSVEKKGLNKVRKIWLVTKERVSLQSFLLKSTSRKKTLNLFPIKFGWQEKKFYFCSRFEREVINKSKRLHWGVWFRRNIARDLDSENLNLIA